MKTIAIVLSIFIATSSFSQTTYKYYPLAQRVFSLELDSSDFSKNGIATRKGVDRFFMLMIDTVETNSPESFDFLKYPTSAALYKSFSKIMKSIDWQGSIYEYREYWNNPFFPFDSPLHTIFLANDSKYWYAFEIWHSPDDLSKIDGFAITRRGNL